MTSAKSCAFWSFVSISFPRTTRKADGLPALRRNFRKYSRRVVLAGRAKRC